MTAVFTDKVMTVFYASCLSYTYKIGTTFLCPFQGQIQDFHLGGGGGAHNFCARTHITSAEPNSVSAGVQTSLRALEVLGLF